MQARERHAGIPFRPSLSSPVPRLSIRPCRRTQPPIAVGRKGTMAKEICISSTPHETRLAILEDDQLAEIYYERENEYTLAGSIYNGRVTRVLPGMQSAFVDIGLERDAFLYVTDFMELEDQEETDELEKAATSSPNQAPREVRHGGGRNGQRQDRPPREARPANGEEAGPTEIELSAPESGEAARQGEGRGDEAAGSADEQGGKRWRGRRRRRGGRGGSGAPESQADTNESTEASSSLPIEATAFEPTESTGQRSGQESGQRSREQSRQRGSSREQGSEQSGAGPRGDRAPAPFVLPGEALSKYGGTPAETETKSSSEPARPQITSKPSTLIDAPLAWDGSGLLPGESLSRHRGGRPGVEAEPQGAFAVEETVEETESSPLTHGLASPAGEDVPADEDFIEESLVEEGVLSENAQRSAEVPEATLAASGVVVPEPDTLRESTPTEEIHETEQESDASASHHVDPLPPSGFRLFGFGGKNKKDEEAPHSGSEHAAPQVEAPVRSASTFAPGSGLVEEELIEGEELDTLPHRHAHKHDEHDLDEYEEETLQTQIRSGELGEMLQEAHLDHRIQMNFDDKAVAEEDEEGIDSEEDDEEEPATAEGQPAGDGQAQPRRDRAGRGRRGRGAPGGGGNRPGDRRGPSRRSAQTSDLPIISDLLKPGQEILVQIAKEPIAKKGARITSHIALPGRFLVFMPTVTHVGVSRKIASDEERHRLKRILTHERGEASGGFIVRTAAEGASEEELRADLRFLIHLWNDIKQRSDDSKSPALIYHDLSLIERILRDQVSANFSSIWVDSEADYERIVRFLNRFSPSLVRRVKLYTKETPLFEHFGIQDEISKALRSKVWLKSRRLDRDQSNRSTGGDRHQHRQVCGQIGAA